MSTYIGRLNANKDLLDSADQNTVQDAYNSLFKLWSDQPNNLELCSGLIDISKKHRMIQKEFENRIDNMSIAEKEKAVLLRQKINSLFPLEMSQYKQELEKNDKQTVPASDYQFHQDDTKKDQETVSGANQSTKGEFRLPKSTAAIVAILVSLAVLIGGLTAGNDSPTGIAFSLILLLTAIGIFTYKVLTSQK